MTKIDTAQVKRGTVLNIEGQLYKVFETSHTHTGRGSASYGFKVKNLNTGNTNTFSYKSGTTLEQADVSTQNAIFLYCSDNVYSFMLTDSSEIYELPLSEIEDVATYLKDNLDVFVTIYNEKIIGIILPTTIKYKIIETVPGIKGDRANAGKKSATLDTGIVIMVPLHYNEGDEVILNTSTGDIS